jgi:1-deoxy-D-xylulose-5-phosphate reductoisomerase
MKKSVSIFGATGSVGQSTLDLVSQQPDQYEII